ncbi:MAG: hypothetical protein ABIX01_22865 [Chitinophagaceae bacterium]
MKTHLITTAAFVLLTVFGHAQVVSGVAINDDATPADASSMLDVKSNTKGLLTPRMTTAERQAIVLAATGLLVFDTDSLTFWFFNGAGWIELGGGGLGGYWIGNGADISNSNAGNVGIGTASPLAPLHIKNELEALRIEGTTPFLSFYDNNNTTLKAFVQNYNNDLYLGTPATNTDGKMEFYLGNVPVMTIQPSGNVGIGTQSPYSKLMMETPYNTSGWYHVGRNGTDSIVVGEGIGGVSAALGTTTEHAFRLTAGALGRVQIYPTGDVVVGPNSSGSFGKFSVVTLNNSYGISHLGEGGNILATRMGGTSAGIGTFSPTNMRIFSGGNSCILIAEATGNVGIGTDNPTYKLSVNGTIRAKELRINTGWADYVFAKDYALMPLAKVESFIKTNQHLPGIAPATKLKKEGVGVSEMQTKMMAKIEELTLYMIEANKTIEVLKQRLEAVEKSNH